MAAKRAGRLGARLYSPAKPVIRWLRGGYKAAALGFRYDFT